MQLALFRQRVALRGVPGVVLGVWPETSPGSPTAIVKFEGKAVWVGEGQALSMLDVSSCELLVVLANCEVLP